MKKYLGPIILFLLAFIIFYIGLGLGLTTSPTLGTIGWFIAIAVGLTGLFWLMRIMPDPKRDRENGQSDKIRRG